MENATTYTAFTGERRLAAGSQVDVALSVKAALQRDSAQTILIFEDRTGRQIDFDLRGTDDEIAARLEPANKPEGDKPAGETKRPTGRPKLGVVAREVTLLPYHWEWLADQPGGASVTLRKLVSVARNAEGEQGTVRQSQQAADRFMSAMLGNQPGYEDASRALYACDRERFLSLTEQWPVELRDHARRLAAQALSQSASTKR